MQTIDFCRLCRYTVKKMKMENGVNIMSGIRYDASKLNDVIRDFCVVTGVSVSVLDDEFETLASYSELAPGVLPCYSERTDR